MGASNYDDVLGQLQAAGLIIPAGEGLRIGTHKPERVQVMDGGREKRGWYWLREWSPNVEQLLIVGAFGVWRGTDRNEQKVVLPKDDTGRITGVQLTRAGPVRHQPRTGAGCCAGRNGAIAGLCGVCGVAALTRRRARRVRASTRARTCAYAGNTPHTPHTPHRPARSGTCGRPCPHPSPHRPRRCRTGTVARGRRGFPLRFSKRNRKELASMAEASRTRETMGFREFADHLGKKPGHITEPKTAGRLVLTDDRRRVCVAENRRLIADSMGPAKARVVARHARKRAAAKPSPSTDATTTSPAAQSADVAPAGEGVASARDHMSPLLDWEARPKMAGRAKKLRRIFINIAGAGPGDSRETSFAADVGAA